MSEQEKIIRWLMNLGAEETADEIIARDKQIERLRAEVAAIKGNAEPVAPAIPEGWVMVPKEPTDEMASAGAHARWNQPLRDPNSSGEIWASMIAATPTPPR